VYDKTYNQVIALFLHTTNMKLQAVVLQLVAMVISLLRDKYIYHKIAIFYRPEFQYWPCKTANGWSWVSKC